LPDFGFDGMLSITRARKGAPPLRAVRFVCSWTVLIVYVWVLYRLLTGNVGVPEGVSDKTAHGLAFGLLTVLAYWAFGTFIRSALGTAFISFLFSSLYGLFGEYAQAHIPHRHADVEDFYADALGAAIGALFVLTLVVVVRIRHAVQRRLSPSPYERTHRA